MTFNKIFYKKLLFIKRKVCLPSQKEFTCDKTPLFAKWYISILRRKFLIKERFKKNKNASRLNILFVLYGGFGEFLIHANYVHHFIKYLGKQENIKIDVCARKNEFEYLKSVFKNGENGINNVFLYNDYDNSTGYDAIFVMRTFVYTPYCNIKKINSFSKKLYDLLMTYKAFKDKYVSGFFVISNMYDMVIANGKNRLQMADIGGVLGIQKNFNFPLPYPENQDEILEKFDLKNSMFITVNRSIGKNEAKAEGTKTWSYDKTNELVKLIKEKYPQIKIVQTGFSREKCKPLNNIDINLIGRTNLEDIKVLVKNSLLHIDGEGGFAHLRNALKAKHPAIILFGPTNPDLYGYDTNINLHKKEACPIYCDWITAKWQTECLRKDGGIPAPCMESITADEVFEAANKYIETYLTENCRSTVLL